MTVALIDDADQASIIQAAVPSRDPHDLIEFAVLVGDRYA